jgi:hypothetical protein
MIRNLKALGLALAAVFAMSAMAATAASAQTQGVLTSTGPVTLDIAENGTNGLSSFGGVTTCTGSTLTGHKYNVTPHTFIPVGATTITVRPHYNQATCKVVEGGTTHRATVTVPTTCDYVLHLGKTTSPGKYAVTADVECSAGQIEVEVYPFANSELGGVVCTIKVGTQTGLSGVTASSSAGHLNATGTFTGVKASKSGSGCATESTETGTFELNATITGTNEAGASTEVSISEV